MTSFRPYFDFQRSQIETFRPYFDHPDPQNGLISVLCIVSGGSNKMFLGSASIVCASLNLILVDLWAQSLEFSLTKNSV